jgi:hypothetical protein
MGIRSNLLAKIHSNRCNTDYKFHLTPERFVLQCLNHFFISIRFASIDILKDLSPSGKKVISLKGILKGVDISEQEIASAKK